MIVVKSYRLEDQNKSFAAKEFKTIQELETYLKEDGERIKANYLNEKHPMTKENYKYWAGIRYNVIEVIEVTHVFAEGLKIKQ